MSTEDCKEFLAEFVEDSWLEGTVTKPFKRVKKFKDKNGKECRRF